MSTDVYFYAILILGSIAILDLVVGVSNDAVNFLNSSIGSRVAPLRTIMIIAGLGILAGVMFSSGMMEVARKGIFHPQFFSMPELITLFLGVMIADILVLDLFNTYGLPTSTTVSIVFELLGAAVALSIIKIILADDSLATLDQYINSAKALTIIGGILLSVVVAFICGALVQYVGRLLFTFDYQSNLGKFGGLWGGLSLASILLFILLKGAKGATFISADTSAYIKSHLGFLFMTSFLVSGVIFQILVSVFRINILKPIVLLGTFSLALAFAANDLVNFVGVPIAGFHAYMAANATSSPLTVPMDMLEGKVPSSDLLLFLCGIVMVIALWTSRKARTVTETEIGLSSHDEENERFESFGLSRVLVRIVSSMFDFIRILIPRSIRKFSRKRFDRTTIDVHTDTTPTPSFDLLRASTNLMVASIVVSFATSLKLPLSTTYVTFMVAMGTSFADHAWGRETAVYRVSGVMTVIGGWFMTAFMAFTTAGVFCSIIYFAGAPGTVILLCCAAFMLYRTHITHRTRVETLKDDEIYNLSKVTDASSTVSITFDQTAIFIRHLRNNLHSGLQRLFANERVELKKHFRLRKQIHAWSNIIAANVFKAMRLSHQEQVREESEYPRTVSCLQSLSESYRDIVRRSYTHVSENHRGLLSIQVKEIRHAEKALSEILEAVEQCLTGKNFISYNELLEKQRALRDMIDRYAMLQNERIHSRSSKTRLSLLYYSIMENLFKISQQSLRLFEIYQNSLANSGEQLKAQ